MDWTPPWLQWNIPTSVFPTTFPGQVPGPSQAFNGFPLQPPIFSPGIYGFQPNLPHPPISVAHTPQQTSSVAPPRGVGIGNGGTAQVGTSPLAPSPEDAIPSSTLVCPET